jgi:hypothetical protein
MAEDGVEYWPDSWSEDMRALAFTRLVGTLDAISNQTVWTVTLDEEGQPGEPGPLTAGSSGGAAFSPEGGWIAYRSNDSAVGPINQIHVQPFPPTGAFYAVTEEGGSYPMWSRDGGELIYRRPAGAGGASTVLASVEVTSGDAFAWGDETILPVRRFMSFFGFRDYDIMPDGERIVVAAADRTSDVSAEPPRPTVRVAVNWFEELKERVPVVP